MAKTQNGIIYQGPSKIDGAPIVVIAIAQSGNSKTGNMVQTYILRADLDPREASRTGKDFSICGTCRHRGTPTDRPDGIAANRSCYVNIGQGVLRVYKTFTEGKYPQLTADQLRAMGAGRMVRLGTYGDPAMIDAEYFAPLLENAKGSTGYTHQSDAMPTDKRLMVSADSLPEAKAAHAKGRRTFRVIPITQWKGKQSLMVNEVLCPASEEAGRKVQCADCGLCDGRKQAKSVAIVAHGTARANMK